MAAEQLGEFAVVQALFFINVNLFHVFRKKRPFVDLIFALDKYQIFADVEISDIFAMVYSVERGRRLPNQ